MKFLNYLRNLFQVSPREEIRIIQCDDSGFEPDSNNRVEGVKSMGPQLIESQGIQGSKDLINMSDKLVNHTVACCLSLAISRGQMKPYKRLTRWIDTYMLINYTTDPTELVPIEDLKVTNETKILAQQFKLLSYKCNEPDIVSYIEKCL